MEVEQPITASPEATQTPSSEAASSAPAVVTESSPATTVLGHAPEAKPDAEPAKAEPAPEVEAPAEAPKEESPKDPKEKEVVEPKDAPTEETPSDQSEEPAPLPEYDAFKLPEGISVDEERMGEFTKMLAEFETMKADHAGFQEFGQKLVDRHIAEVQSALERQTEAYTAAWEKQKNEWRDAFVNDPEIGGNRQDTTVRSALEFIKTHGGTKEQQAEFHAIMESSGLGNHPAMIRLLANAMDAKREGTPVPAGKPASGARSRVATRYGNSS